MRIGSIIYAIFQVVFFINTLYSSDITNNFYEEQEIEGYFTLPPPPIQSTLEIKEDQPEIKEGNVCRVRSKRSKHHNHIKGILNSFKTYLINNKNSTERSNFYKKMKRIKKNTKNEFRKILSNCTEEKEQIIKMTTSYIEHARDFGKESCFYYKEPKVITYAILFFQDSYNKVYCCEQNFLTEDEIRMIENDKKYFLQRTRQKKRKP